MPSQDFFHIADLLVRCSAVPLARVAEVLGFDDVDGFAPWFERHGGRSPEMARTLWTAAAAPATDQDAQRSGSLRHVRRVLASVLDPRDVDSLINSLRARRPIDF